ncbi:MAG TPA: murein biosynthesis integral membrane protein MurJ [Verrucomicrobiae bacterium]|nr:murein biosynthesis integral membrane protein MurJ [Verrucomicrobiae bacterium]
MTGDPQDPGGKPSSLLKSTGVVSSMTLISRVLGFVREILFAAQLGMGAAMDVFFVAFRIPNLFRRLFAEGAFTQAFVPVFTEARAQRSPEEVQRLVELVAGTLAGFLACITALAVLGAPWVMLAFAPGFIDDPAKFEQGVELLRWTFPYLLFISLTALAGGVLNAYGKFAATAFNPVWLNVCLIGAALFVGTVEALAIAVLAAGIVQLAFLLPGIARLGLLSRPRWGWSDPQVRKIMRLMVPIMIGSSASQFSLILDTIVASFLPGDGNVAWLWYADRLMEFPLGTFSVAIATVLLPSLARAHVRPDAGASFRATLDWGLRLVLLIGLPAMLGLLLLAGPMVSTIYQHGVVTPRDVTMTSWALAAYAVGFLGFSLVKVLVTGFYARQETRAPLRYAFIAFGAGMACTLAFTALALATEFLAPHAAIALATSTGALVNAALLFRRLRRDGAYVPAAGWGRFAMQLLLANAALAAVLVALHGDLAQWTAAPVVERVTRLSVAIGGAAAAYFAALLASGVRLRHFRQSGA